MKKVLIIGISGTGKTYVAKRLSEILDIPIIHYDSICWDKNWTEVDEKIVEARLKDILSRKNEWVMEGYIEPAARERLEEADTVIYLDYSGLQAFLGGLQRWWNHRGKERPELAQGCVEKFDWEYLKVMWKRLERKDIENAIKGFEKKVIRIQSRKELDRYLNTLEVK